MFHHMVTRPEEELDPAHAGIGLGKIEALERECGESIELMRAIKKTIDPQNIMNPGKVLRI